MKNMCVKLGGLGALLICIPVMYRIYHGEIFNPASYFLWTCLTVVCVIVLVRAKKGGVTMMACYIFSDLAIGVYAYIKNGKVSFGNFEWFIVVLTCICATLYLWCEWRGNFRPAIIANAAACTVAGLPQFGDSVRYPYQASLLIFGAYLVVSSLSYYGEKPNLNGRLIPGISAVYWIALILCVVTVRSIS